MDEEGEDVISIGGRPKSSKEPNPLNQARRDARERGGGRQRGRGQRGRGQEGRGDAHEKGEERQVEQAPQQEAQLQEPQSKIPPFNDGSEITRDWTTSDLFDDPIKQHEVFFFCTHTCASVVFTRLTQAAYNKDKPIAQRRNLPYRHLANHIKSVTGKKESFSFRNFSIAKDFIRDDGIHREGGYIWKRRDNQNALLLTAHVEAGEVFEKLETVPLRIILEDRKELHEVGMEIYKVPGKRDERCEDHALLAVAKGRTQDGVDFIVVQNSWGMEYGNNGYCRIFLPDTRKLIETGK
ncbi:hypothetical protein Bca101_011037 [Brassica carinata]